MDKIELRNVYNHSINNKQEIMKSEVCGCFYCREIFDPKEIKNWIKDTAQCPYCYIDSVIGNASGICITKNLLEEMHKEWFKSLT